MERALIDPLWMGEAGERENNGYLSSTIGIQVIHIKGANFNISIYALLCSDETCIPGHRNTRIRSSV